MSSWLVVGRPENWETAFDYGNIWGLKESQLYLWEELAKGDKVFFYATAPVSRVIGYGELISAFKQDKPLWPEELTKSEVIWPLRFQFDVISRFRRDEWSKGVEHPALRAKVRSGFQRLDESVSDELIDSIEKLRRAGPMIIGSAVGEARRAGAPSLHEQLKEKLLSIGGLQKWIAEKEYPMDGRRLDVTWRRVERGAPT